MSQIEKAGKGRITREMKQVAKEEGISPEELRRNVRSGFAVVLKNKKHKHADPVGIGRGLRVKVNANIGTSPLHAELSREIEKLRAAIEAGADTVMDLSTGGEIDRIRREIVRRSSIPVGSVPIYQTAIEAGSIEEMDIDLYLKVFRKHARDGIDFTTVHAGVTKKALGLIKNRVMKCVSRGGSFLLSWMKVNRKENFLFEYFEEILKIAGKYNVTLSLGDGLRPGCISDSTDKAQICELKILGKLAEVARENGVQVIIEGPGHVPLNEIEKNVRLEKKYCNHAPFFVLGPLPTDIAAGYDHVAASIGAALAAWKGADFLCYVTPKEHVGLPSVEDVREGVIAAKIAAHVAEIAKGNELARERDLKMSVARENVDWNEMLKHCIYPKKLIELRRAECEKNPNLSRAKYCSMCGAFCVFRVYKSSGKNENHVRRNRFEGKGGGDSRKGGSRTGGKNSAHP